MSDEKELDPNDAQTCEGCGKQFSEAAGEISYGPDPYMEEINNRVEEKWLCKQCYRDYCEDI